MKAKYFLLKNIKKRSVLMPIKIFKNPEDLKVLANPLGWKIFQEMKVPACPKDVAKKLGIHEQKVYYYINRFRASGLIEEVKTEARHGTIARFYKAKNHAFGMCIDGGESIKINIHPPQQYKLLEPFIAEGRFNAKIIVGSPDPHGPWKARGSDSCCAIDFALFMGTFSAHTKLPNYMLDVEIREKDLKDNLVLFGGPVVNMITKKINSKLPIYIDIKENFDIKSKISGRVYKDDECGFIAIIDNPWKKEKKILVLAGKRFQGTKSAVLAWIKYLEKIMEGNKFDKKIVAKVVRGYDMDGDGVIDSVDILE